MNTTIDISIQENNSTSACKIRSACELKHTSGLVSLEVYKYHPFGPSIRHDKRSEAEKYRNAGVECVGAVMLSKGT